MKSIVLCQDGSFFSGREHFEKEKNMKKIFVTVSGGVAEVMDDTVPKGFEVEIIDFDNIEAGDDYPSKEAVAYAIAKGWDRA